MQITTESHLDHGIDDTTLELLRQRFADRDSFLIETFTVPGGRFRCDLHGPACGDLPVLEAEVLYRVRGQRPGASRVINRDPRWTDQLTVIAGPSGDLPCVLYTTFGGPAAPREPFDPSLDPAGLAESRAFWAEHALSMPDDC